MESIIGIIAGFALISFGILRGSPLSAFLDLPSVFITLGGSLSAMLVNFSFAQFTSAIKGLSLVFKHKPQDTGKVLNQIVEFAKKARRDGLLALEDEAQNSDDPFLKKGIQLIVDGTDPELVRNILEIELSFIEERHKSNKAFFDAWGGLAPGFGMIGTVIGLVQMLGNLDDIKSIGPNMAVALITTFYGALWANLFCIPIAGKMARMSGEEQFVKQIMIEGILSIQAGENPRIVEEKLLAFLSASQRVEVHKESAGGGGDVNG
jgi:chemotaxis protein MotA